MWIAVNPERLGDRNIPHGVGGQIQWHPCLFWPGNLVEIMVKPIITCLFCFPSGSRSITEILVTIDEGEVV